MMSELFKTFDHGGPEFDVKVILSADADVMIDSQGYNRITLVEPIGPCSAELTYIDAAEGGHAEVVKFRQYLNLNELVKALSEDPLLSMTLKQAESYVNDLLDDADGRRDYE